LKKVNILSIKGVKKLNNVLKQGIPNVKPILTIIL
jgi:hypothetical protein